MRERGKERRLSRLRRGKGWEGKEREEKEREGRFLSVFPSDYEKVKAEPFKSGRAGGKQGCKTVFCSVRQVVTSKLNKGKEQKW